MLESSEKLSVARLDSFDLPEKILQFGTGVLLRGLPDYFIHQANCQGIFNGRVVIVKSTQKGSTDEFHNQNSLYTIGIRGVEDGREIEENMICSAVSRVLSAETEWNDILKFASSPDLQVIISNTTEIGIQLVEENIDTIPPKSFPGKLLAVLYQRYKIFGGDESRSLVILPTELISNNGDVLKGIVSELAEHNRLPKEFIRWLETNTFCNTLVDRIIPGKPDKNTLASLEEQLGYCDELLFFAEPYRLWAIEGDERIRKILTFEQADSGVIITEDITFHKELKLRLLNGTHSLSCAAAYLSGIDTVREAMADPVISHFIKGLIQNELASAIPYPVPPETALQFSEKVLDRFRNPYIRHQWITISSNYTLKLQMRVIPVLQQFYIKFQTVPEHIAFGFAAYLRFMKCESVDGGFVGFANDKPYRIEDDQAEYYSALWAHCEADELVTRSLSNSQLWKSDLTLLPGFVKSVTNHLRNIEEIGVKDAIKLIN